MRNIAEIIEDDKNGKQLSQTERQIAIAYIQGKYDAVRELKIVDNSNTNKVLDKIRAEIEKTKTTMDMFNREDTKQYAIAMEDVLKIIDKYKVESEG